MGNSEERAEGAGPFTTRLTWRLAAGETAVWESRAARKRGTLTVRPAGATESGVRRADAAALNRLRRLNGIAAGSFTLGGALFVLGAAFAQFSSMSSSGPPRSTSSAACSSPWAAMPPRPGHQRSTPGERGGFADHAPLPVVEL